MKSESLKLKESCSISVNRGTPVSVNPGKKTGLVLPIKERGDIELFDGPPIVTDRRGRDVSFTDVLNMPRETLIEIGAIPFDITALNGQIDLGDYTVVSRRIFDRSSGVHKPALVLPAKNRKFIERTHNFITTIGFNWVSDLMSAKAGAIDIEGGGMEVSDDATAESLGDDDILGTNLSGGFQSFLSGYPNDLGTGVEWKSHWAAGQATDTNLQEVVIKPNDSIAVGGITRIVYTLINKGASDTLSITITWNLS